MATRQTCEARGLKPGTIALSRCELDPPTNQAALTDVALGAPPSVPAKHIKSYFYASNGEIRRREQAACVELGEDPATTAFAQCVADLQGELFDADNPMH
jgi:hypothetical protein